MHTSATGLRRALLLKWMTGSTFSFTAHAKDLWLARPEVLREKVREAEFVLTCTDCNRRYLEEVGGGFAPVHRVYHTVASLRDQITVLLQDAFLFRKTVRENIDYGREDAREEEVVAAANAAEAHQFIQALPQGYDTLIEEGGTNFSGGQKQRLNIARAILRGRPILILDEPIAALDALAEAKIKTLDRLTKGFTTFIIAHCFSTLANADHIVFLEAGAVSRQGSHAELIASSDAYRRLWHLQYGGGSLDTGKPGDVLRADVAGSPSTP